MLLSVALPLALLPLAVVLIVVLIERLRVPAFLALMIAAVAYGTAARLNFHTIGKTFANGFVQTLEQLGLLIVAGAIVAAILKRAPLGSMGAAAAGVLGGLGGSAAGSLALLQPVGTGAQMRAVGLVLTLLATHALVSPSPIAVAAAWILQVDFSKMAMVAAPAAMLAIGVGWFVATVLLADKGPRGGDSPSLLAVAIPVLLLVAQSLSRIPSEPLGKGSGPFYTGISESLMLAILAIALAVAFTRRWPQPALGDTSWAPLLLAAGAAGGVARVFEDTGIGDRLAEMVVQPGLGLLAPFLAAVIVKTVQGNSLSAVLTATGITETMLGPLGLDTPVGRALAAAAAGAGSIAFTHVNDPLFWIGAHMAGLSPRKALLAISLGSGAIAFAAMVALLALKLFL